MTNLANLTPAEIDSQLADHWADRSRLVHYIQSNKRWMADAERRGFVSQIAQYQEQNEKYEAEVADLNAKIAPLNAEFDRRGGWDRYYLVANNNGHIHATTACSTCFPTTQFKWLVDLADKGEANLVAEFGELACTVCFPSAPTFKGFGDGTSAFARLTNAEKDAKAAAKAEKDAIKAAKSITAPDGSPLRDHGGSVLKTLRSAQIEITSDLEWALSPGGNVEYRSELGRHARRVAEAVAAKMGRDVEDVMAEHTKKALKKLGQ